MKSPNAMAGRLQDVLTWERPQRSNGSTGQRLVEWVTVGSQRCHVEAVAGSERMNADQPLPQHSHRITIRSRTNAVAHDWRAIWSGRTLNVVVILPSDTADDWQVVLAQEQAPTTEDN